MQKFHQTETINKEIPTKNNVKTNENVRINKNAIVNCGKLVFHETPYCHKQKEECQ